MTPSSFHFDDHLLQLGVLKSEKFSKKITAKAEGELRNGVPEGRWVFKYPNGAVFQRGSYQKGRRSGTWLHYMQDGTLAAEVRYSSGRIQSIEWNHKSEATFFFPIDAIFRSEA